MRKLTVYILYFTCCAATAQGQTQPQAPPQAQVVPQAQALPLISQYMHQISAFNPAHTGWSDLMDVALWHRNQWTDMEQSPVITTVRVELPLTLWGRRGGAGLTVSKDKAGAQKDISILGAYALRFSLGRGSLSVGILAGITNRNFGNNTQAGTGTSSESKSVPELGGGALYKSEHFYAGVSVLHANQPSFGNSTANEKLTRLYYMTTGYYWQLHHPDWQLRPSLLVVSDSKTTSFTGNITALYNKRIWVGVSYGKNNSVAGLAGIALPGGLEIGYSYDRAFSGVASDLGSSHEFLVRYRFYAGRQQATHKYRSVRFL